MNIIILLLISLPPSFGNELGGFVCRLPKNIGYPCGVTTRHSAFYFDADIRECIEFMFEGCGGNQNRFPSKEDCLNGCKSLTVCGKGMPLMDFAGNIKRCDGDRVPCPGSHECVGSGMSSVCCQKSERICRSSVHPGTNCGVPPVTRYYFDDASKTCRNFAYTGCGGNENNFNSKGECLKFCANEVVCARGDPHPDRYSINSVASCTQHSHCPRNYTCSGQIDKKKACCPSKDYVCGMPYKNRASCRQPDQDDNHIWWFDYRKGECIKQKHSSCEENFNSFANKEQCIDYCIGTCPNGGEIHLSPRTEQPVMCDHSKNIGCPMGFECYKSSPYASICCRTAPICPSAESMLLLDEESKPVHCSPERPRCPDRYSCQQAKNLEHICCTKTLECPSGMQMLRDDGGRPRVCSVGVAGTCPANYMCVKGDGESGLARHLCCAPKKVCVVPYVDITTKRPQRCFPGDESCPLSTECLPAVEDSSNITNAIDVLFYCCHAVHVFECGDGSPPLLDPTTGEPARCITGDPFSCPMEHTCQSLGDGSTACCPLELKQCGEALLNDAGEPLPCKGWDDNGCPEGKCRKALDGRYYCCRELARSRLAFDNLPFVPASPTMKIRQMVAERLRRIN